MSMRFCTSCAGSPRLQDSAQHFQGNTEIKPKMFWPLGPLGSAGWQDNLQMLLEGSRLGTALPYCPPAGQEAEHR